MTDELNLNGKWKLYYFSENESDVNTPEELKNAKFINATVPGNVELDMADAGKIDTELFKGMTTEKNQILEDYSWWYEKKFTILQEISGKRIYLNFGAVDCLAEYFVNGRKVFESENAFMEIRFEVTDYINPFVENIIDVHIKPAIKYAFEQDYNLHLAINCGEQSYLRKPAHCFGWDIFPRAVSAGIWREVKLEISDGYSIDEFGYYVSSADEQVAVLNFQAIIDIPYPATKKDVYLHISGKCGESEFEYTTRKISFRALSFSVEVKKPKLWWPYGYGDANIYDLTYELFIDKEIKDSKSINVGIRTVELMRTESLLDENHCFKFVINGTDIMCKGSNWVPLDAYHSRDAQKYTKALKLFTDTHCNIVRIWGGGVYEQDCFYDYCDRNGIMVWQDFMMACVPVSQDEKTINNIKNEATWVVKKLRSHPSIILWSGDNEIDELNARNGKSTDQNIITRKILPAIIDENDTFRPYLASSPYISDKYARKCGKSEDIFPERHLWGARDYFKADFYANSKAHFVSETGYHGCPCLDSVKKIVDSDFVWPIFNEQWALHSSDQHGNMFRVTLMWKQIEQLFDIELENIDDFILASQISQAEAKKFFIERIRIKKPYASGIIWWNMLDGWPQMSDAVVDYFFEKKLAYEYIKRSQEPIALMIDEMHDWHYTLVGTNDTLQSVECKYRVYDIDTNETLAEGDAKLKPNSNYYISEIKMLYREKRFLVIEWSIDSKKYINHYLCGMPPFDFSQYQKWLNKYKKIQ